MPRALSIPSWPTVGRYGLALGLIGHLTMAVASHRVQAEEILTAQPAKVLPGTHGRFDFITVDSDRRRLLAAHSENGTLDVIGLETGDLIKAIPTGSAQDCVIDSRNHRYLVSVSKPPQLAVVDADTLALTETIPLEGPADLLAYHESSEVAYVCHDDGKEVWAISLPKHRVIATVALPTDGPEDLRFDTAGQRLFQAMKTAGSVAVIELASRKVAENWPTAPVQSPHGLVTVPELEAILVAGGNGRLALMSQRDGRVMATASIPQGVDEIAYDPGFHRVYCASGQGKIAVLKVEVNKLTSLGEVTSAAGAHAIALDAQTHSVWITYAKDGASFGQSFRAKP